MNQSAQAVPPPLPDEPGTFVYEAQSVQGDPLRGTIDALSAAEGQSRLRALGLRLIHFQKASAPAKPKPVRGDEFAAFNQQLAQLTAGGLPVERGLRLIAQDTQNPRLRAVIQRVAEQLNAGKSLGEAFDEHRGGFPPLYGRLLDAGVKSNNLPGMLFNLGRHLDMIHRLRSTFWQAAAYPLILIVMVLVIVLLIGIFILPQFANVFADFDTELPTITRWVLNLSHGAPLLLVGILALAIVIPIVWRIVCATGADAYVIDAVGLPLPLVGRVLKLSLVVRWCDSVRLGVEAGLDLPRAIELAGAALASPTVAADSAQIIDALRAGRPVDQLKVRHIIPSSVTASIDLASRHGDLASTLAGLTQMHVELAELRLGTLRAVLAPILLLFVGALVGLIVVAMFMPLTTLITSLTGGH